jgi:tetratricopeptide (TPR) repeat protein
VDLHRRLTIVHSNLGHQAPALASARRAVEIMSPQQRSTEDGIELLRLGLVAASETGAHEDVLAFGDGLQEKVVEDREWNTAMRIATAQLALGNPQGALQIAMEILDRDQSGTILAFEGERPNLFWVGFQGALQLGDPALTELWAAEFAPYLEGDRRQEYYRALSRFRLSQGQSSQAHSDLMEILQPTTDPAFFREVETIGLTLDLFRVLQDADVEEHAAGLTFLAQYAEGLPAALGDLQAAYGDSIASFTVREGTRAILGEGFQYWRDANFVQMIRFFEQTLETGGLEQEQEILARGFLASSYLSAGRRDDAETAYRAILELDPLFDIDSTVEEVQALYDVTLFDAQTIAAFREIRRIR